MIKIKGTETASPTTTGTGTNLSNATMVRVYNSGTVARLVTVQTSASPAVTIGTFTLAGGAVEYVDKNNTDEIFSAHAEILLTSVIIVG